MRLPGQLAAMARFGFWFVLSGVVRIVVGLRGSGLMATGLVHMACIAVAVMVSRGVFSWLAEVLPRVFSLYVLSCALFAAHSKSWLY